MELVESIDTNNERIFMLPELKLSDIIYELDNIVNEFIKKDTRDVVFDLSEVINIDSKILAEFIRLKKRLTDLNRNFSIINPNEKVLSVITISGMDDFLLD